MKQSRVDALQKDILYLRFAPAAALSPVCKLWRLICVFPSPCATPSPQPLPASQHSANPRLVGGGRADLCRDGVHEKFAQGQALR